MTSPYATPRASAPDAVRFDAGLRRYMLSIYNNMGLGLVITGAVALLVASTPSLYQPIFGTPLKWVAMLAPLAFVFFLSSRIERMTTGSARTLFFVFAAVMGISMASIFLVFTGASIARTFFIAATMFLGVSLWGYTTRSDLSKWGTFLFMGVIGVIAASLINLFIGSTVLQTAVSLVGVAVFTGLTAWDTQRLRSEYLLHAGTEHVGKLGIIGALSLYLNLVNLFQLLLTFFGQREEA